jgi:hypothetical protein
MLLKNTISKRQVLIFSAAPHGSLPLWAGKTAWDTLCNPDNQIPLFIHHDFATENPIYGSNTESELEHAVHAIISDIYI